MKNKKEVVPFYKAKNDFIPSLEAHTLAALMLSSAVKSVCDILGDIRDKRVERALEILREKNEDFERVSHRD